MINKINIYILIKNNMQRLIQSFHFEMWLYFNVKSEILFIPELSEINFVFA